MESLADTEILDRLAKVDAIKDILLKRFGTVFDTETGEIHQREWEEINLLANCGEVSRKTNEIIEGDIKEIMHIAHDARLVYLQEDGTEKEIADGNTMAIHSYVVDTEGNVWDPTVDQWGILAEEEFLKLIVEK